MTLAFTSTWLHSILASHWTLVFFSLNKIVWCRCPFFHAVFSVCIFICLYLCTWYVHNSVRPIKYDWCIRILLKYRMDVIADVELMFMYIYNYIYSVHMYTRCNIYMWMFQWIFIGCNDFQRFIFILILNWIKSCVQWKVLCKCTI